jgi:hypothetical protein
MPGDLAQAHAVGADLGPQLGRGVQERAMEIPVEVSTDTATRRTFA